MNEPIGVVIVEDHALTRAGLRAAFEASGEIRVDGEAADGIAGERLIRDTKPQVAVLDIGLPGMDGIALTRAIKADSLPTRVIILTMHELDEEVMAALSAGADAYCVKSSDPQTVIDAVRIVAGGGAYFDPRIAHFVLRRFSARAIPPSDVKLSPRELDVLRLMADGTSNADIAMQLHLGFGTVKGHIREILEKLHASDRTQAAVIALRKGLL